MTDGRQIRASAELFVATRPRHCSRTLAQRLEMHADGASPLAAAGPRQLLPQGLGKERRGRRHESSGLDSALMASLGAWFFVLFQHRMTF